MFASIIHKEYFSGNKTQTTKISSPGAISFQMRTFIEQVGLSVIDSRICLFDFISRRSLLTNKRLPGIRPSTVNLLDMTHILVIRLNDWHFDPHRFLICYAIRILTTKNTKRRV